MIAAQNDEVFGLRLPGIELTPERGELHRDRVLKALALFEYEKLEYEKLEKEES